ncbi:aspartic peptidase A1 [Epithele typhae]|uniref:aspartic peptidase A1 n=1 Tax=Epithele typhae TaxID=378194 RepID=UPI00200769F7|nr:aspartic peptidase A1 [Epithele typhae]KAH9934569.1 aspartic peptidase A1 [Epithele typhae]
MVHLPMARRFNSTGAVNVLKFDQARAEAIRKRGSPGLNAAETQQNVEGGITNIDATSQVVSYVVSTLIGNPPHEYQLLVDTGSSNTWAGAGKPFIPTLSSQPTGDLTTVQYGSGIFVGMEVVDQVTLAPGLTLPRQSIGDGLVSMGFSGVDGILGIGPKGLTCGSFLPELGKCVPTVTDTAFQLGLLTEYMVGISFAPSATEGSTNGELTFGGIDTTKFNGPLDFVPLTRIQPANAFVGVDQTITYGRNQSVVLDRSAGILDTGTTLILIASDAFERYTQLTGATEDEDVGLLKITQEQFNNLQSLFFTIGEVAYELIPNAQIWPRALNPAIGGAPDSVYLIVADMGSVSGLGLDFINGMAFLERYYMVYDVGGSRAGLAQTANTFSEIN